MSSLHDVMLTLHVVAGTAGLGLGAWVIWASRDRPVTDGRAGAYHSTVAVVAVTSIVLVVLSWSALWWLAPVAVLSYGLAAAGHLALRRRFHGWRAVYAHGFGGSYIALVTALLVVALTVDGPLGGAWAAVVWALPTVIGTVLIRAWRRRIAGEPPAISWGRLRLPLVVAGTAVAVLAWTANVLPDWLGLAAFLAGLAFYTRLGAPRKRAPIPLVSPVAGRWRAANSPRDRVPSHGVHAYGQTFAVDLVHEPADSGRPSMGWWPLARPPERFPGFGCEVRSPADGVVVHAHDGARDHWSRNSYPALVYLLIEAGIRELTGPTRIFGNHVVLDIGRGVYVALAHLERGSVTVEPGDAVSVGQPVARCGNSGNSSEPHLHLQCMDHESPLLADGIPFTFEDLGGLPTKRTPFDAAPHRP